MKKASVALSTLLLIAMGLSAPPPAGNQPVMHGGVLLQIPLPSAADQPQPPPPPPPPTRCPIWPCGMI